jgi:hypothetical protein
MVNEKLSGAFIELYKVTGIGGAETETLLGFTKDDVTVSMNPVVAEVTPHQNRRRVAKGLTDAPTISFGGLIVGGVGALVTLGVIDGSNRLYGTGQANLEGLRLKVYENHGDITPKLKWLFQDVAISMGDFSFPAEDFAAWEAEFMVGGFITKET